MAEAAHMLLIEAAWLVALLTAALSLWRYGVRSYAAEGG
jgi:ABC-type uncharacterized transport system permease subunit